MHAGARVCCRVQINTVHITNVIYCIMIITAICTEQLRDDPDVQACNITIAGILRDKISILQILWINYNLQKYSLQTFCYV